MAQRGLAGRSATSDPGIAAQVQQSTGVDVSHARHHSGPEAQDACAQLGAEAYTVGSDVAFAGGSPKAETVAHEYAHVAQQTGVDAPAAMGEDAPMIAPSGDAEAEADAVASSALSGKSSKVSVGRAPSVQKKESNDEPPPKTDVAPKEGESAPQVEKKVDPPPWVNNDIVSAKLVHMPELRSIIRYLKGKTYDSDVTAVMQTLSHWDLNTIQGAWYAINQIDPGGEWLGDILDNIGIQHIRSFPRETLGTLRAANPEWKYDKLCSLTKSGVFSDPGAEDCAFGAAILKELPANFVQRYTHEHADRAKNLYKGCPSDVRKNIDAAISPEKEKALRATEMKERTKVAEEQSYLGKGGEKVKYDVSTNIGWLKDKLSGNWIGHLSESSALSIFSVFQRSIGTDPSGVELRILCRAVEETKYMDRWLEKVPESTKYKKGIELQTFLHILRNRPPEFALVTCERLVTTGLFNWSISEAEARLAYELIRIQPLSVQQRFREKDGGKWLALMETHLGKGVIADADQMTLDEKGALVKGQFGTASTTLEAETLKKQEDAYKTHLAGVDDKKKKGDSGATDDFSKFYDIIKGEKFDAKQALSTLDQIAAIEINLRGAIVRRLDAAGLVDRLTRVLGNELWTEANAPKALALLAARDPMRSVAHIRDLVQEGRFFLLRWIDGMTPGEANLAFNIIRVLPPQYRQLIRDKFPAWEGRIDSAMDKQDKGASSHNLYEGGKDQSDRMSILSQLSDAKLWDADPKNKDDKAAAMNLEEVIRMTSAAGQRKVVFDTAQKLGKLESHHDLLVATKIIDAKGAFLEKEPVATYDKSFAGALGHAAGVGLSVIGQGLIGRSVIGESVDLDKIQDLGDSLGGAHFKKVDEDKKKAGVNRVTFGLDIENGRIQIDIPALEIDEFRTMVGDMSVSTGAVTTGKVSVLGEWPTKHKPETAAHFDVSVENPQINDLMIVQPGKMTGVKSLGLKQVSISMSEMPDLAKEAKTEKEAQKALKEVLPSQSFFMPLWELIPKALGLDQQASNIADSMAKGPGGMKLNATGLHMEGIAQSNGTHVGSMDVGDIKLETQNLRSEHAKAQLVILKKRFDIAAATLAGLKGKTDKLDVHESERLTKERDAIQGQVDEINKAMPQMVVEDKEYLALYQKQKTGVPFDDKEAKRFKELNEKNGPGGFTLQVAGMSATGVGMTAGDNKGSVDVGTMTAMGTSNALGGGFLSNPVAAAQVGGLPGKDPKAPTTFDGDMQIASVHAKNLTVGGSVPDYRAQDKQKKDLEAMGEDKLAGAQLKALSDLQVLWKKKVSTNKSDGDGTYGDVVRSLLELEAKGMDALQLKPDLLAQREHLRGLLKAEATTIGEVDLRGIKLSASSKTNSVTQKPEDVKPGEDPLSTGTVSGNFGMEVGEARIKDVSQAGGKGVKEVSATGVKGNADLSMLYDSEGHRSGQMKGTLEADSLHMEGVKTGTGGATVGSVDIEGAKIGASTEGSGSLSIEAKKIEAHAVEIPPKMDGLKKELAELSAIATPTEAQKLRIAEINDEIRRIGKIPAEIVAMKAKIEELQKKMKALGNGKANKEKKDALGAEAFQLQKDIDKMQSEHDAALTGTKLGMKPGDPAAISISGAKVEASGVGNFMDSNWSLEGKVLDVGVDVPAFAMGKFSMEGAGTKVAVDSASASGFHVQVSLKCTQEKDPKTGAVGYKVKPVLIKSLHVDHLGTAGLNLDLPIGSETLNIGVKTADLDGIDVKDLYLGDDMDPTAITGAFSIDKGKADVSAKIGKYFGVAGKVNIAQKMSIEAFANGDVKFRPGNLNLEQFGFHADGNTPPDSMVSKLRGTGGVVTLQGFKTNVDMNRETGKVKVKGPIGSLAVGGAHWAGGTMSAGFDSASLQGVDVDADIQLDPAALNSKMKGSYTGDKVLQSFKLNSLTIAKISGSKIHFADTAKNLNVKLANGTLNNVRVTNWTGGKAAHVEVGVDQNGKGGPAVKLDGLEIVKDGLSLNASAQVDSISVDSADNGKVVTDLKGISATVKGTNDGNDLGTTNLGDGKGGGKANVGVTLDPDGTVSTNFNIPTLRNAGLKYTGTARGQPLEIDFSNGSAGLTGVSGSATYKSTPGKAKDTKTHHVTLSLGVSKADVQNAKINYGAMKIGMPSGAIKGIYAKNIDLTLEEFIGADGKKQTKSTMTGAAGMTGVSLTDANVMIPGMLSGKGSLSTGGLDLNFLSNGDMDFDLDWIKLHPTDAKLNQVWAIGGITAAASANITGKGKDKAVSGKLGGDGSVKVDVGNVDAVAAAKGKGVDMPGGAAEKGSGAKLDIDLAVLDTMKGGIVVTLPGGTPLGVPMTNGHLIADLSKVPSILNDPLLDWLPGTGDAIGKLTRHALAAIVKWLDDKLRIRPKVEEIIKKKVGADSKASDAASFQSMLNDLMKDSVMAGIGLETLTTEGKGVTGWLGDELGNLLLKAYDKVEGDNLSEWDRKRIIAERTDRLRTWLGKFGLSAAISADGPFSGKFTPGPKAKGPADPPSDFSGAMGVKFGLTGSLGAGISADLKLSATGVKIITGDKVVKIDEMAMDASADVKDKDQQLQGGAGAKLHVGGIHYSSPGTPPGSGT
ncbi:MAG: DUF4157 domain-containing protein [Myxococcota bacterium]